jgi:ubiquinone/menaquinone biosynthesis C-methylase UbiE
MRSTTSVRPYLPAAGRDWLLPLYDPLTVFLGVDAARRALLDQSGLPSDGRVLDVGCGTGSLAVLIAQQHPGITVVALDPDPNALARAVRKARRAGTTIQFDQGFGDALPYPDEWFDRVFSSMMFHHVAIAERPNVLREIHRVLKPGGRLELVDFEGPKPDAGLVARLLHSHHRLEGNDSQQVVSLLSDAGFATARRVGERSFLFGGLAFYQASRAR